MQNVKHKAVHYLSMREHSYQELVQKLLQKGYESDEIDDALGALQAAGLQSDRRFSDCFARNCLAKGQGPIRIQQALKQRGISDWMIKESIQSLEVSWDDVIEQVWRKKYVANVSIGFDACVDSNLNNVVKPNNHDDCSSAKHLSKNHNAHPGLAQTEHAYNEQSETLDDSSDDAVSKACAIENSKESLNEKARQWRFLQYRGFPPDVIGRLLNS